MGGTDNFQHVAENVRVELEIHKGKVGHVGLRCQHMYCRLGSLLRTIDVPVLEEISTDAKKMAVTSQKTQADLGEALTRIAAVLGGVDNEHAQNLIDLTEQANSSYEDTIGPTVAEVSESIMSALGQIITGIKEIESLHSRLPALGLNITEISGLEIRNTLGIPVNYAADAQGLLPQAIDALGMLRNNV